MMLRIRSAMLVTAALAAGLLSHGAAQAASTTAKANATILAPLSISNTQGLNFGSILPGTTAGTVSVSALSARNCSSLICSGNAFAAAFTVISDSSAETVVTVDNSVDIASDSGGSMTVTLLPSATTLSLTSGTTSTLTVGGSLAVGASQKTGSYTGTFSVSVDYN